jgi:hypothetical protein
MVVLAMTLMMSSVAMAEITFDGSIEFLMRSVKNLTDWNDDANSATDTYRRTYERVRFGVNAKHENVKGRLQIENDWDTWADGTATFPGFETRPTNDLYLREAWLDFNMPFGVPGHIKVGRQFLQLGNGWFFRSNKYGSDAWVVGFPGKNTIAFVDVKVDENDVNQADDTDAYVLLDTYKIDDKSAVGAYIVHIIARQGETFGLTAGEASLDTLGLHYNGMIGPVKIGAEFDIQSGEVKPAGGTTTDLSGYQAVVQASMAMNSLTLRATAAMGTGDDPTTANESEEFNAFMDKDPHYTLVYEYFMATAAGSTNTSFANTTALSIGADFKINKMITVGADLWMLTGDQKFANNGGAADDEIGNEVDVKVNLTLYDQLTWNTTIGLFMPGKGYENAAGKADDVTAVQSVLSYKF